MINGLTNHRSSPNRHQWQNHSCYSTISWIMMLFFEVFLFFRNLFPPDSSHEPLPKINQRGVEGHPPMVLSCNRSQAHWAVWNAEFGIAHVKDWSVSTWRPLAPFLECAVGIVMSNDRSIDPLIGIEIRSPQGVHPWISMMISIPWDDLLGATCASPFSRWLHHWEFALLEWRSGCQVCAGIPCYYMLLHFQFLNKWLSNWLGWGLPRTCLRFRSMRCGCVDLVGFYQGPR